jgi:hypothetical protein
MDRSWIRYPCNSGITLCFLLLMYALQMNEGKMDEGDYLWYDPNTCL